MSSKEKTTIKTFSWFMWFCGAVFYLYQFVLRVSPTVMVQEIRADLGLQNGDLGVLISYYYNGYAWFQIPAGFLLDYMGPRRPIVLATAMCGTGCLLFGFGEGLFLMSIGRLLMGVGSAFAFLSALKIANLWFPTKMLPLIVSLTLLMGSFGATIAGVPLSMLIDAFGWRGTILIFGAIGFALMIASYVIVHDHPVHADKTKPINWGKMLTDFGILIRSPQTWVFGLFGFCMYVPLSGFGDLWGTTYIMTAYSLPKLQSSACTSAFYLGVGLTGPFLAAVSNFLGTHRQVMRWTSFIGGIGFVNLLFGVSLPYWLIAPYLFVLGGLVAGQFLAFTSVSVLNPPKLSGRATGVYNMFSMLSGVVFQPVIGSILDFCVPEGGKLTTEAFQYGLSVVPIVLFVSFLLTFLMKESYSDPAKAK